MSHLTAGVRAPVIGLLAIGLLAGCSGSSGLDTGSPGSESQSGAATTTSPADPSATSSASPTATPTPAASVDPEVAAESAVADAYRLYDAALVKSLFTHNARVTDLIRYATAPQQARNRSRIKSMREDGIDYLGTPRMWLGPVTVAGNRATVHFCEKDNASWYEDSSGKLVGTKLDRWNPRVARMLKRDSRWLVDLVSVSKSVSCKGAH